MSGERSSRLPGFDEETVGPSLLVNLPANALMNGEIDLLELGQKLQGHVQSELSRNQKEFYSKCAITEWCNEIRKAGCFSSYLTGETKASSAVVRCG